MKTVQQLHTEIAQLQEEVRQIQQSCEHAAFHVFMWSWRPGSLQPCRICNTCSSPLPGITEVEANACWDAYNAVMSSK